MSFSSAKKKRLLAKLGKPRHQEHRTHMIMTSSNSWYVARVWRKLQMSYRLIWLIPLVRWQKPALYRNRASRDTRSGTQSHSHDHDSLDVVVRHESGEKALDELPINMVCHFSCALNLFVDSFVVFDSLSSLKSNLY